MVIGGSKGLHLNMERHHRSFVGGHHYTFELADDSGLGDADDLDDRVGARNGLHARGGTGMAAVLLGYRVMKDGWRYDREL